MAGARVDENIALGIRRHAGHFAEIDVVGKLQRVGGGIEGDLGHAFWAAAGSAREAGRGQQERQKAFHGCSLLMSVAAYCASTVFAACGFRMSFCTRQDSISPTMISFGLRQSIM